MKEKQDSLVRYFYLIPPRPSECVLCTSMSKIALAECKMKTCFQTLLRRNRFSSEAQRSLVVQNSFCPFDEAKVR